ncbi:MAG: sce7726 family protein [Acidobacteria bacterium]|nr:sce7726 family protein [Acidobacteriota bacterium]
MKPGPEASIRTALKNRIIPRTGLVVDELGIGEWSEGRVDVAHLGLRYFHGYEIKSEVDSLARLPRQMALYVRACQRLTVVLAHRHLARALPVIPAQVGIVVVRRGPRGGALLRVERGARPNQDLQLEVMAKLLWRRAPRHRRRRTDHRAKQGAARGAPRPQGHGHGTARARALGDGTAPAVAHTAPRSRPRGRAAGVVPP